MKMRLALALLVCCTAAFWSGCYKTLEGRSKMGTPLTWNDKIEGRYERSVQQVFEAAKTVLARKGALNSENTISRTLQAKVDTRTVWVKAEEIEGKVAKVIVQARTKGGNPDIALAAEIEKDIALALVNVK